MTLVPLSTMNRLISEGMQEYWRVVNSPADDGLSDYQLKWKRDYERGINSFGIKYGAAWDEYFGQNPAPCGTGLMAEAPASQAESTEAAGLTVSATGSSKCR